MLNYKNDFSHNECCWSIGSII